MKTVFISIVSPPEAAHSFGFYPQFFKFAEAAKSQGYAVVWCCSNFVKKVVTEYFPDDDIRTYPDTRLFNAPGFLQPLLKHVLTKEVPQWLIPDLKKDEDDEYVFGNYCYIGFNDPAVFKRAVLETLKAIIDVEPDLLYTCGCPVGLTAGHIAGLPIVTLDTRMPAKDAGGKHYREMNRSAGIVIRELSPFKEDRIPVEQIFRNEGQFRMVWSFRDIGCSMEKGNEIPMFDITPDRGQISRRTGFDLSEKTLEMQKVFCAYFGFGSVPFKVIKKVLSEAFAKINQAADGSYHCYVGSQFVKKEFSIGNVHFAPFFDLERLSGYSKMVFTHGGLNSVTEMMTKGVPLMMVPGSMLFERRFNCREVESQKAGVFLEIEDFTADNVAQIILNEKRMAALGEHAGELSRKIKDAPDMEKAFVHMKDTWLQGYDKGRLKEIGEFIAG